MPGTHGDQLDSLLRADSAAYCETPVKHVDEIWLKRDEHWTSETVDWNWIQTSLSGSEAWMLKLFKINHRYPGIAFVIEDMINRQRELQREELQVDYFVRGGRNW